jgi:hypothetical protein
MGCGGGRKLYPVWSPFVNHDKQLQPCSEIQEDLDFAP